jgi:hypothetical protein
MYDYGQPQAAQGWWGLTAGRGRAEVTSVSRRYRIRHFERLTPHKEKTLFGHRHDSLNVPAPRPRIPFRPPTSQLPSPVVRGPAHAPALPRQESYG